MPFCKLEAGHEGLHTASEEDGWKNIQWGKPDMIAWNLRQEDSQKLNVEEQLKSLTVLAKSWGYDEAAEVITIICERMSFNMDG